MRGRGRTLGTALVALVAATAMVACSPGDDRTAPPARSSDLVVASFDFAESHLLAEIYAQALERAGVRVRRELDLGPRELVAPALEQGFVDLVPEYVGSALAALDPAAAVDRSDPPAVRAALAERLRSRRLRVLDLAPAQNQNGLVVTAATAARLLLRTTSDLVSRAPSLTLGGPRECPTRRYCLAGLRRVYGLRFRRFVPLAGPAQTVRALEEKVVDVGVMFTTDGPLAGPELVLLADDRRLQPVDNVVPVVRADALRRHPPVLAAVVNAVSRQLSTDNLRFLNWRVAVAGKDPAAEARGWLRRHGFVTP